jgi:putative CocE/NonD family hydrolase
LFGVSYDGTVAELLAARNHPAVKAVAAAFTPWDIYLQPIRPGGLLNLILLEPWGAMAKRADEGSLAEAFGVRGWRRWLLALQWRGPKPVDEDKDRLLLAGARAGHSTINPMLLARKLEFRDDGATNGLDFQAMSPAEQGESLTRSGVPMLVTTSWLDMNYAAGALQRFQALPNPQTVIIGPWSHGGDVEVDPLSPLTKSAAPSPKAQWEEVLAFMRFYLLDAGHRPQPGVRYITLGAGTWRYSPHWPPEGLTTQRWYFTSNGRLDPAAPITESGTDDYSVDFEVTSGASTRWSTLDPSITYSNRAFVDSRLLSYTGPVLQEALEVTGTPLLNLYVSSTASDGAFHAYLEDLAPDGRVTYLTEGLLRAIQRRLSQNFE